MVWRATPGPVLATRAALLLLAAGLAGSAAALELTVTGSWSTAVAGDDLAAGAGSNLVSPRESAAGQASLDIGGTADASDAWRVDVQRSDSLWPPGLGLQARRTSNGSGPGSISGGTSYVQVDAAPSTFFSGAGDRDGVAVQLRLTDLSIQIPPDVYAATVIYTVVDL